MPTSRSGSAAHIVIRPRVDPTPHAGLRRLIAVSGPNKNEVAIAFITACIGDGVNTEAGIVGLANHLNLNPRHVAVILKKDAGNNPASNRWRRDGGGIYSLFR